MYEVTFRIEDTGSYAGATAGTDAHIELWCNDHCDLLYVTAEAATETLAQVRDLVGVRDMLRTDDELVVVTGDCLKAQQAGNVETYLERHDCLLLPPIRYADGAKFCRLLALDATAITACYRDLLDDGFTVDVERKREATTVTQDSPLLALDDVLPTLTDRQREVFSVAFDAGYYEIPRETTTAEIAAQIGVERRTAEEHLRRAENKLVEALAPYLAR